jgi:hypothetical protein
MSEAIPNDNEPERHPALRGHSNPANEGHLKTGQR